MPPYSGDNPLSLGDPSQLEMVSLSELTAGRRDAFWLQEGAQSRTFFRRRPIAHDDPDKRGIFNDLTSRQVSYGPVGLMSLVRPTLYGFRSFVSVDNIIYTDQTFLDEAEKNRIRAKLLDVDGFVSEKTGLVRTGDDSLLIPHREGREINTLDGSVIVLSSDEPDNYGSFLFRVLPKISMAKLLDESLPILAPRCGAFDEFFELAGIEPSRVIKHDVDAIYVLDQAFVPTLRNPQAFLDDVSLGLFAAIRDRTKSRIMKSSRFQKSAAEKRMLFVSRRDLPSTKRGYRQMLNEAEMIDALVKLGFEIIEPQLLTAEEQVNAFSSASIVCGQSGAGMFNVVFCKPGTYVIDIESEPYWIHAHMCLFSSLNLRYTIVEASCVEGGAGVHRPFSVNVARVVRRIEEVLEQIG